MYIICTIYASKVNQDNKITISLTCAFLITNERNERSSYQQSYIGRLDENQTTLKPLKIPKKMPWSFYNQPNNLKQWAGPTRHNSARPQRFLTTYISKTIRMMKNWKNIWGDANISKFNYRVQRSEILFKQRNFLTFFQFRDICVPDISKNTQKISCMQKLRWEHCASFICWKKMI